MTLGCVAELKLDWAVDFLTEKLSARPLTSVAIIILPNRPSDEKSAAKKEEGDKETPGKQLKQPDDEECPSRLHFGCACGL